MESLQLLKYSFKKGEQLTFTAGMSEEAEIKEMEAVAAKTVPEDMRSYIRSLGAIPAEL
jgi:hypothetical protein